MAKPTTSKPPMNFRAKRGVFEWTGMVPDGDPGSLNDNQLRIAINCRFKGPSVLVRGGQSLLGTGTGGCAGLFDFQVGTPVSIYFVQSLGCPGQVGAGASFGIIDPEQGNGMQMALYYSTSTTHNLWLGSYAGSLYILIDNQLRQYLRINAGYGVAPLTVSGINQDLLLVTFTGYSHGTWMQSFSGFLFIGLDTGGMLATSGKISTWDGTTTWDDVTGIYPPSFMGLFQESLVIGYQSISGYPGAPNKITLRAAGPPPGGAYTDFVPGAGSIQVRRGVSYKNKFYMVTGIDNHVWAFDGTTVAITHSVPTGTCVDVVVLKGILYVLYTSTAPHVIIASFDGTTWTDVKKDITAQVPALVLANNLTTYRGNLYVDAANAASLGNDFIYFSPGTNIAGTWTLVPQNLLLFANLSQLIVF